MPQNSASEPSPPSNTTPTSETFASARRVDRGTEANEAAMLLAEAFGGPPVRDFTPATADLGSNEPEQDEGEAGAEAPAKAAPDLTDPEEFYKTEITTGDGEKVTIGALKDAYQSQQATARETAKRAVALDERESALYLDQQLINTLGTAPTPAAVQQYQQRLVERDTRERSSLLAAMPELKDAPVFEAFRKDVVDRLGKYGIRPNEVVINDHRQLLIVRDLIRAEARIKALLGTPAKSADPAALAPQGRSPAAKLTGHSRGQDAVSRVSQLIGGARSR